MDRGLILQLAMFFIIVNVVGLYVGYTLIQQFEGVAPPIVNDNPDDPINSLGLLIYMLVGTGLILLAIKFLPDNVLYWVLKGMEALALVVTAIIVFSAFVPVEGPFTEVGSALAVILAVALVCIRIFAPQYLVWRNISSIVATIGVGALLGASIGIWPVIVFLIALAAYDYIAVFKTKHMVKMAKAVAKKNLSFTFALPTEKHQFELGTGDLVMPLVFGVSILNDTLSRGVPWPDATLPSIIVLLASFIGLAFTLDYGSKNVGKALPALPLQVGLMIIVYGLVRASGLFG